LNSSFDSFVGIDWSGDKKSCQKGLKIAWARPGSSAPKLIIGCGPKGKWSRLEAVRWIQKLADKERALIGLDFAFGFPPNDISLNWEYVERLCCANRNFYGGEFFRMENARHSHLVNSPWWRRGTPFVARLRATERAASLTRGATPQSIFNAVGAAQVGPSSISGMRALLHLRQNHADKISIWPLDELDDRRSVIVEIFPHYFPLSRGVKAKLSDHGILNEALKEFGSATVKTPPKTEDEGDALLSAAASRCLSLYKDIFRLPDSSVRNEGWIFGVPVEGEA
jgi:hypothetical protein